ncbi:MAG TPA: tRNA-uridine aminocarboxypropyltransferase [Paucimonas sp.]|nr:tRNA-uridine aminocarboxypropyltransferase [Paucimonas sp.]
MPVAKRLACELCLRPQSACICRWVHPLRTSVEVLILQHPMEAGNAKGSARLLHLSLPGSRLVIGETFDPAGLQALLHAPFERTDIDAEAGRLPQRQPVLLYPENDALPSSGPMEMPVEPSRLRLVVLDGTWRKSRKMLYLNPLLQGLPRLPLKNMPRSHYLIRKAHRPDHLSTLEAACYALMRIEGNESGYWPLLHAFDGFVAQQMHYLPPGRRPES